jgi:hypothetical protein
MVNAATKKFEGKVREGPAKINIQTSEQNAYERLSTISNLLYINHISIQNAFFTPTEIFLILSDKAAAAGIRALGDKDSEIALLPCLVDVEYRFVSLERCACC